MNRRDFLKTTLAAAALTALPKFTQAKGNKMKILVLTGSPRKNGNSNTLADYFIKGAQEAGHEIVRFDAAFKNVHPCIACNRCGMDGPCVFKDDFEFVRTHIVDADMVVFATPMYYFGVSAQLKAALLMTYANSAASQAQPIKSHYEVLLDYLGWQDAGQIIASGVWTAGAIESTSYPEQAYKLGKSLT